MRWLVMLPRASAAGTPALRHSAGMTDAARAGQREQPDLRVLKPGGDVCQLTGSAEDPRRRCRQIAGRRCVLHQAAGDGVEPRAVLLAEPQRRGEPASGVVVDDRAEAALHIADGASADARSVRELLLGHPGRRPSFLSATPSV
jgi:hypothetical protein